MDLKCNTSLDQFLHAPFLTSSTSKWPVGINNAFMLARPQHPFLKHMIYGEKIQSHAREWPFPWLECMMTTGFMFLSNAWMDYVKYHKHPSYANSVFVLADDHGRYKAHSLGGQVQTPLFYHGRAGAWHTWDAPFFLFFEKHSTLAIVALVLVALAWILATLLVCCRRLRFFCEGRSHRQRKAMRQDARRDMSETRKKHAEAKKEMERRRHEVLPSHHTTSSAQDNMPRLLAALAPAQRATSFNSAYRSNRGRSISPMALPARTTSYPGSHAGRTSSMMIPPRDTGYAGRPSSVYDFAY